MIELNVYLIVVNRIEHIFMGAYYRSIRLPCVVSCELVERAFVSRNSEKPCVLDKASVVYFKGKLYLSRCKRFCQVRIVYSCVFSCC